MRILRIADLPDWHPGGIVSAMKRSSEAMAADGHVVEHLLREGLGGPAKPGVRRLLAPWLVVWHVLRRVRRGTRYDVVEIHEPLAAPYALLRRRVRRLGLPPCVVLSHGTEERAWRAQRERWRALGLRAPLKTRVLVPLTLVWQARRALRGADHVIVLSEEDADYVRRELGVPSGRVTRISNAAGDEFRSIQRAPRNGRLRLVTTGTWIDRKGTPELVSAFSSLLNDGVDATLTLAGTMLDEDAVLDSFREENRERVVVRPTLAAGELATTLAHQDVFVLPSWFEGMPLSTLEAAAAGLACVVSATCGHLDIFRAGAPEADGAVLVPPNDAAALSRALRRLAEDPQLTAQLGERARERVASFTWAASAAQTLAAYRSVSRG
jgi:glycosyltransferase involved in cell wall biosynthesis